MVFLLMLWWWRCCGTDTLPYPKQANRHILPAREGMQLWSCCLPLHWRECRLMLWRATVAVARHALWFLAGSLHQQL